MRNFLVASLVLVLTACSAMPVEPDLERLHRVSSSERLEGPVVLIHGALGARLKMKNSKKEIWPGPLTNFIFNRSQALALEIDPQTLQPLEGRAEAYALFKGISGSRYARIRHVLEKAGYSPGKPGHQNSTTDPKYYVFVYDWRQDLVAIAAKLDQFIDQIRRDHNEADLKVDIVAHSMGALVTSYFLRYGSKDVLDSDIFEPNYAGAAKTRRVISVGAPNLGSISGLEACIKGGKLGLVRVYPEILATMPAAYQVLPHPDRAWAITTDGKNWNRDLYSVKTWRDYRWSIFDPKVKARIGERLASEKEAERYFEVLAQYFEKNLGRAKRFHQALSQPLAASSVRYIALGSDCKPTPARCLVEQTRGQTRVRCRPSEILNRVRGVDYDKLMLAPGDGRVTRASLLARNVLALSAPAAGMLPAYTAFFCERHDRLIQSSSLLDNMLNILLGYDTADALAHRRDISLSQP